jgi:hypothetical protein
VLAGLVGVELERAPELLARALDELGMPVPSERDGWLGLAVEAAAELLAGDLEPAEAAGIAWEAWLALDAPEALAPLASLSDAWDDLVDAAFARGMDLEAYRLGTGRLDPGGGGAVGRERNYWLTGAHARAYSRCTMWTERRDLLDLALQRRLPVGRTV